MKVNNKQSGFTIIELMIATTVFSVVLLICSYALLAIGRAYYKGIVTTRTQEAARRIVDDVADSIKFNGGKVIPPMPPIYGRYCIGSKRYSFNINQQRTATNNVLYTDEPLGGCAMNTGKLDPPFGSYLELVDVRMRLGEFEITEVPPTGNGLYKITVIVASGDDDVFKDTDGTPGPDTPLQCKNDRHSSQFCAVSELTTIVKKRI